MFIKTQGVVYSNMLKYISPLNPNFNQWAAGTKAAGAKFAGELGMTTPNTLLAKEAYFRVQKQVFVVSFDSMAWVMVICFGLAAIPMIFLKKPSQDSPPGAGIGPKEGSGLISESSKSS